MPELPEVETIVRGLAPRLAGRRVENVEVLCRRIAPRSLSAVAGQTIRAVGRQGKFIVAECDRGRLSIHLGMTGKLLLDAQPGPHTRAIFTLDRGVLLYDDIRQFGRIEWNSRRLARLGPDPIEIEGGPFIERLRARRSMVKPLLLNQSFLRGIGNIYADEALFRARIHPRAIASGLSRARAGRLHAAIREVLLEAIDQGGSSISDYVDADGREGSFQDRHRVYGRGGEPCPACKTAIRRILVAQRGTHFCPRCQRRY
ncbi:MAG: bifunctional DNA-formamidopyrimidine glycosylase/DNA-(apurinic or apyrimidinic site) lyase [Acidobacteria bacterium]|nr:bifunctional DNA-formamidopyrimidine glycosylase/DNA-(apurinic or apyrimidinic site) lyase [Acidobacteriota bacterium]